MPLYPCVTNAYRNVSECSNTYMKGIVYGAGTAKGLQLLAVGLHDLADLLACEKPLELRFNLCIEVWRHDGQ